MLAAHPGAWPTLAEGREPNWRNLMIQYAVTRAIRRHRRVRRGHGQPLVHGNLTASLAAYQLIVLEGCNGTGKTSLGAALAARHGYTVVHSGRTPDGVDLVDRYETMLTLPGRLILDRSFSSELVYGPLDHGRSRLTLPAAVTLAQRVAERGGVVVHLTGRPAAIVARLRARDGPSLSVDRISALIGAYHDTFALLSGIAPIVSVDTTVPES